MDAGPTPSVRQGGPLRALRSIWTYLVATVSTAYVGGSVILYRYLWPGRFRRYADRSTAEWSSLVLRGAGVRLVIENAEQLGRDRGQVLVSNHQSWFDVFALAASLPVKFSFVGKKELSRIPFLGQAWEKVGHIPIDRSDHKAAIESLQKVDEQFRAGRTIVMFPEGTRSPTGELARFKKGAFVMAIKSQVPVVPVAVAGTRTIMEKGDWIIVPGTATIRVGEPISTKGLTLADRGRLTSDAHAAVSRLLNGKPEAACRPS
ncbi:MAG: 1-acyl-sn-glycerol-3-phosphate acyltransferase [Gemmatimonadetes bacterium]|nr:1-acyl-sn-glycerol-3-phosphate acyltransferase [Gemmatimonadota bacterium]MYE70107.1 1-acyl-sn-glycerol-3-phosphate acyltransferase [Gemmatimonadota bacterium]MYJ67483.1 1-acyl-sn-glycerol-3-phosphate acyltransferase [Gemmatimonadota bacterium]